MKLPLRSAPSLSLARSSMGCGLRRSHPVVVVLANLYCVERQTGCKPRVDLVYVGAVRFAARDISLIGDDDQQKAFALQFLERRARPV
jgi:hypothetical protein